MKRINALNLGYALVVTTTIYSFSAKAVAVDSDFPTSCQMSTQEREEDMQESRTARASKYLLSEMPSVVDDCAFGERMSQAIDGFISDVFAKIPSLDPLDDDFFCGFGAQDAWAIGATTIDQEGRRDYSSWYNDTVRNANREARGLSRQVPGQVRLNDNQADNNWNEDNVFNKVWNWSGDE